MKKFLSLALAVVLPFAIITSVEAQDKNNAGKMAKIMTKPSTKKKSTAKKKTSKKSTSKPTKGKMKKASG